MTSGSPRVQKREEDVLEKPTRKVEWSVSKPGIFGSLALLVCILGLVNCSKAYFATMEKFGVHKREILVDRVKRTQKTQEETKETFVSALDQFRALVEVEGGDLEKKYTKLKRVLDKSEAKANELSEHIDEVESVSKALFKEWEKELKDYSNESLRKKSSEQLAETQKRYDPLMRAMRKAEESIEPVLVPLRDQVLYLKHNLNARAIASLETELTSVQGDASRLIQELESAIAEADRFLKQMDQT